MDSIPVRLVSLTNKKMKNSNRDRLAQRKDDSKRHREKEEKMDQRLQLWCHQLHNSWDSRIWKAVGRVIPLGFQREHGPASLLVLDISSPELGDNNFFSSQKVWLFLSLPLSLPAPQRGLPWPFESMTTVHYPHIIIQLSILIVCISP